MTLKTKPQGYFDGWRPEIEGWSNDILPFYESIVEEFCGTREPSDHVHIAELGVMHGRSCLFLAERLAHVGQRATIVAVDKWDGQDGKPFQRHLKASEAGVRRRVLPYRSLTAEAAEGWADQFDLVFIDSDHSYTGVRADIDAWLPNVKPGGIIAGHDFEPNENGNFPGVRKAVLETFGDRVEVPVGQVWMVRV